MFSWNFNQKFILRLEVIEIIIARKQNFILNEIKKYEEGEKINLNFEYQSVSSYL